MWSCTGTTFRVPEEFASGGRNGSHAYKSSNSSLTLVCIWQAPRNRWASLTTCVGFVYYASYTYFTSTYFQFMPHQGHCAGEEFAAFAGMGILSSYLLLFISFYFATYKKDAKVQSKRDGTAKKATIDMAKTEVPSVQDMAKSVANASANGASRTTGRAEGMSTRSRKA